MTAATEQEVSGKYKGTWIQEKTKDNDENALCIIKSITYNSNSTDSLHKNFNAKGHYRQNLLIQNNVNLHPLFNAAISIDKNSQNEEKNK